MVCYIAKPLTGIFQHFFLQSNIIKGKIQHDKTFAVAAAIATANNFKKNNLNLICATLPN